MEPLVPESAASPSSVSPVGSGSLVSEESGDGLPSPVPVLRFPLSDSAPVGRSESLLPVVSEWSSAGVSAVSWSEPSESPSTESFEPEELDRFDIECSSSVVEVVPLVALSGVASVDWLVSLTGTPSSLEVLSAVGVSLELVSTDESAVVFVDSVGELEPERFVASDVLVAGWPPDCEEVSVVFAGSDPAVAFDRGACETLPEAVDPAVSLSGCVAVFWDVETATPITLAFALTATSETDRLVTRVTRSSSPAHVSPCCRTIRRSAGATPSVSSRDTSTAARNSTYPLWETVVVSSTRNSSMSTEEGFDRTQV